MSEINSIEVGVADIKNIKKIKKTLYKTSK